MSWVLEYWWFWLWLVFVFNAGKWFGGNDS